MGNALANAFMQGKFEADKFLQSLIAVTAQLLIIEGVKSAFGLTSIFSKKADGGIVDEKNANGGIVGAENGLVAGNSYWGDRMLVGINSGEMVLNKQQQQRLFNMIASPNVAPLQQRPVFVFKNLLDGQKFVLETNRNIARTAR